MSNQKHIRDITDAMYDHRLVTVNLTNGRSVRGRISGISEITFGIGSSPKNRNRFRIDLVESVTMH